MKILLTHCLLAVVISLAAISCSGSPEITKDRDERESDPATESEWVLAWSDEFDSDQLDEEKWSFQYGTGEDEGLTRWGNNEFQYYTDREENVYIEDGKLHITARQERFEGMDYTSGRIRTLNKADWTYGRFEIRAKLPEGRGIWPAIWMLPSNNVYGGWPKSGEIDLIELVGHEPETVHGTVHYGPDWPDNEHTGGNYSLAEGTFSDDFHTFSIEWEQDRIRWFVDGEHFFTVTPSDLQPHNYPFNERFHLLINLAVGGNWPGSPDPDTEFPQELVVDYVRVYQLK